MFKEALGVLRANLYSRSHYLPLLQDGLSFRVDESKAPVSVRIQALEQVKRAAGYRFSKYSIHAVAVTSDGDTVHGFGEDSVQLIATQKALSEAVERAVFRTAKKRYGAESSNGWACHPELSKAMDSARNELIERDSALAHWHLQAKLAEISPSTLPEWLQQWRVDELAKANRYNRLRVMSSTLGYGTTASVFIVDEDHCGFVSHASAKNFEHAVIQALTEVTRIAALATGPSPPVPSCPPTGPIDHALYYMERPFPEWIFGKEISFREATRSQGVTRSLPSFQETIYRCGKLYVVRSRSEMIQDLYFGSPETARTSGRLNYKRLRQFGRGRALNLQPHFVP